MFKGRFVSRPLEEALFQLDADAYGSAKVGDFSLLLAALRYKPARSLLSQPHFLASDSKLEIDD
ncbi:MAG: hypothetical protein PUP90_19555 [Nostoc sp. S4]|nr:hypothetical protein [Nostoc sp. S4]